MPMAAPAVSSCSWRWQLQLLHFWLLLGICLAALLGSGLISTAAALDHRLHTPCASSSSASPSSPWAASPPLCPKPWPMPSGTPGPSPAQDVLHRPFPFFTSAEYCILTIVSYDRYVAICKPLHYGTLMDSRACATMAAAAWGTGLLYCPLHTASTFMLPLCKGNAINQFFCETPQILKLSCSQSYLREAGRLYFVPPWRLVALYSLCCPMCRSSGLC
ncbi:olfactory receptor 14C36-like [Lagopus muta]|uniref:olfactory receptor 14C36-like n=1 Tax=Lagopus muta TaxID=64668 RepID=UPI00209EE1D5|nr:olfactory receptor 14C36-like [Lagopus muta]